MRLSTPFSIPPGYVFNQSADNIGIKRRNVQEFLAYPPAKIPRPRTVDGPSTFVINMVNSLPDSVNDLLRIFPDLLPSQPSAVPISIPPPQLVNPFFNFNTHLEQKVVKRPMDPPVLAHLAPLPSRPNTSVVNTTNTSLITTLCTEKWEKCFSFI